MTAQWFIIKNVRTGKAWKDAYGAHQNYGLILKGIGAPVKLELAEPVVKEPQAGDRIYGQLVEEQFDGDARIYYKLEVKTPPADYLRQQDIHAQVAMKEAINIWIAQGCNPAAYDNIKDEAVHLARMIEEIKEEL